MNDSDETRDPVERLAEEFVSRCRRGEHPSIDEYAEAHPAWAEQIRMVFPTLLALEDLKLEYHSHAGQSQKQAEQAEEPPERLGDFRILRTIAHGGMGVVYEAEQESLGRRVAIKVLPDSYASSPQALRRFHREAQAAARLHHTNIVSVFGVGEHAGKHFFVMEYIEGRSLDCVVAELSASSRLAAGTSSSPRGDSHQIGSTEDFVVAAVERALLRGKFGSISPRPEDGDPQRLPPPDAKSVAMSASKEDAHRVSRSGDDSRVSKVPHRPGWGKSRRSAYWRSVAGIGLQVAAALHYAHRQGILHRDIKPGNLLLDDQGIAWITDFGLAKFVDQDDLTHPGDVIGTLRYMAPEQLEGEATARSDVYSLGLTLYELLTLRPAFNESNRHRLIRQVGQLTPPRPRSINADIPADLETIVLKAIAREPAHRYRTAGELAEDLQRFLEDRPIRARRTSVLEHAWRWCRRNPALASLTVSTLVLLVLVMVGPSVGYLREARLRAQAETQQQRAEANLALAAEAFEDVFTKLSGMPLPHTFDETSDRIWLGDAGTAAVGKKEAQVLEGLLRFYDRFAAQNRDNTRWQYETAQANRRVGDIQQRLVRFPEAEEAYRRAATLYEGLARRFPDRAEYRVELAAVHSQLGSIAMATDHLDEAFEEYGHARQILTRDAAILADSVAGRFELAKVYRAIGLLAIFQHHWQSPDEPNRTKDSDAETSIRQAIALLSALAKETSANGAYQVALAECYENLWGLCRLTDRNTEAKRYRAEAARILERLLTASPSNPEYRQALARLYAITEASPLADATEVSEESLQRAADLLEEVVASHPDMPEYHGTLAMIYGAIAECRMAKGQDDDSVGKLLRRSIELLTRLNDEFPSLNRHRFLLGRAIYMRAVLENHRGQLKAARINLEEMIRVIESLPRSPAERSPTFLLLAQAYTGLADLLARAGETTQAAEAAAKARDFWKSASASPMRELLPRIPDPWDLAPSSPPSRPDSTDSVKPAT